MNDRASCKHDLSFPFHNPKSSSSRLSAIQAFMEEQEFDTEYFGSGETTALLERKIADIFGKEAALWCPTGTMAQGIAAQIHARKTGNNRLLLHPTSHLLLHENDGYRYAHHLEALQIGNWDSAVTADLIDEKAACAFVELPQRHNGGLLPSWEQLTELKKRADDLGLALHLDGARIWSCRPFYNNRSYADITDGFSSIYVSLYKDIGAIGGAVLLGDKDFITEAEVWRSRLGGLMIEPWPMVCDALRLLDRRLDQMPGFVSHARDLAARLQQSDHIRLEPEIPHVNMFHVRLPCSAQKAETARDAAARQTGIWLASRFWDYEDPDQCSMEVTIGEKALAVPVDELINAVEILAERCTAL